MPSPIMYTMRANDGAVFLKQDEDVIISNLVSLKEIVDNLDVAMDDYVHREAVEEMGEYDAEDSAP